MIFNFTFAKEEAKNTPVINKEDIDTFIMFLSNNPTYVGVRPQVDGSYLFLNIKIAVAGVMKVTKEINLPADEELVCSVIYALYGDIDPLENYNPSEHQPKFCDDADLVKQEIFEALLNSMNSVKLQDDLITKNGDTYLSATFTLGYKKNVNITFKKNAEITNLINAKIAKEEVA